MATQAATLPKPANKAVRVGDNGEAWIEGYRCEDCGSVFAEQTMACRACASRTAPQPFKASEHGTLYSWSVVYRSFPGIETPFVSAIVDLDDGPSLKGTVRDVDPEALEKGMAVRLIFDDAGGALDKDGAPYVGYHFVPEGAAQ